MANIGILQDLTIFGSITAVSAVHASSLVVDLSSSIPEVAVITSVVQGASGQWDQAYAYVASSSANPTFDSISAVGDVVGARFLSGGTDVGEIFEPKGYSKQFTTDIEGDGVAVSFTYDHPLSTQDVIVNIIEKSTGDVVFPAVTATSAQFVVEFANPFVGPLYRLVAMGSVSIGFGNTTNIIVSGETGTVIIPPVSSVAGRVGHVVLSAADITVPVLSESTSFTIASSDIGSVIKATSNTATTITVPTNATLSAPLGAQVLVVQMGTGQITIAPAVGVTIRSSGSKYKTVNQYSLASLVKVDTNEWVLGGELTT